MAIIQLQLKYGLDLEEVFQIAKAAGLNKQSRMEVAQCWDMVQIWQDWFTDNFGEITAVQHRSQGQDPPDLELIFAGRTLGMEHTRLQPEHLGQAAALLRNSNGGGFIPPIYPPPANSAEMTDIVAGVKPVGSSLNDELRAIFDLLAIRLREKMGGMPCGGIIGMVHDLVVSETKKRLIAEIAHDITNRPEFADFANYSLILLDRANQFKFYSSLVRRGENVLEQVR